MIKPRNRLKGSAIVFGAALAVILVILGVAFALISMYMGAANETKNAVDAATLYTGKQLMDKISVQLTGDPNQQLFMDVTTDTPGGSPDGKVDLRRINRVWAKALLIAINADAANNEGTAGSSMDGNVDQARQGAQAISDALSAQLTNASNLYTFFDAFAGKNSVRMLGKNSSVSALQDTSGWQTSLMDRNAESNLVVTGGDLPPGYTMPGGSTTPCTRNPAPSSASGLTFLKGYFPISINNRTFWQVPFQYDEKPHLVSETVFAANTQPPNSLPSPGWDKAVPNAYSALGRAIKTSTASEKAMSWVLTNPRQNYSLSMPHSFVKIHLDDMNVKWYFFPTGYPPVKFYTEGTYGYTTDSVSCAPAPFGGIGCATVDAGSQTVGADVVGRPLDDIIFGAPDGGSGQTRLESEMVARINQMVSDPTVTLTASDLHNALGFSSSTGAATVAELVAGERDFYIYSTDGKTIKVNPQSLAVADAPWLATIIGNDPDGSETKLVDDAHDEPAAEIPPVFTPTATPLPCFTDIGVEFGWFSWDKDLNWTPGTGYNGCLGTVRVTRWTQVYSWAYCEYTPPCL